jgi:hypothetical protein
MALRKKSTATKAIAARKTLSPSNIALFFGAGAELSYGMPTGGRFALEVIRRAPDPVAAFKADRARINAGATSVYKKWLPDDFMKRSVTPFGKTERSRIFEDSLRNGSKHVISSLDVYDEKAKSFLNRVGIAEAEIERRFSTASGGSTFGAELYSKVAVSDSITRDHAALFDSRFFSAVLTLAKVGTNQEEMTRLARATMQFYLGAHGQGAMSEMSLDPLKNAPDDNPAFAELGQLFDVNPVDAGIAALEAVMAYREDASTLTTPEKSFSALALAVIENAVEQFLDYRSMLDELLPALFRPRDNWAKFTKVSLFLRATREYMLEQQKAAVSKTDGYYHDLVDAVGRRVFEVTRVGTSNYTSLCQSALATVHSQSVIALNGSLDEYLDPYKMEIIRAESAPATSRVLVPFLFTQSGVKPLTSVEISRRYVEFYDTVRRSDATVVAGFGFHGDDGHINSLFRQAIDIDAMRLIVLEYTPSGTFDEPRAKAQLGERLRIDNLSGITVLPVDNDRRVNGNIWTDAVADMLEAL